MSATEKSRQTVFLVHGWNHKVRNEIHALLVSAGFDVTKWDEGMRTKRSNGPASNWENLRICIDGADKVVVLLTPDEEAKSTLKPEDRPAGSPQGAAVEPRPRPNVLYELGLAHAWKPADTVLVTFDCEPPSDLDGLHRVYWRPLAATGEIDASRMKLLELLVGEELHPGPYVAQTMQHCDELVSTTSASGQATDPPPAPTPSPAAVGAMEPAFRFPWTDPIDAIVIDGKLRLIVPDGRAVRAVDPVSGAELSRCPMGAVVDEVEITHDGLFVCARAGDSVIVAGLDTKGDLHEAWAPVPLPARRNWQLLTAEGRGGTSVRILVADETESRLYEASERSSRQIDFPPDPATAAAMGPRGLLTLPEARALSPGDSALRWDLVDSAAKSHVALTIWAAGPRAAVERRSPQGSSTRELALPGDARQVAIARQRRGTPSLILAHVDDELLAWRWDDLESGEA